MSLSLSAPMMFSLEVRNEYLFLICWYLVTFRISFWKIKLEESLTRVDVLVFTDAKNYRNELLS